MPDRLAKTPRASPQVRFERNVTELLVFVFFLLTFVLLKYKRNEVTRLVRALLRTARRDDHQSHIGPQRVHAPLRSALLLPRGPSGSSREWP
jgi:hypothetical protein